MALTIVALLLFIAMIGLWVALPGSTIVIEPAYEADPAGSSTIQQPA